MSGMTKSKITSIVLSDEIREAINDYCVENGVKISELIRNAVLEKIGREDLISTMRGPGERERSSQEASQSKKRIRKGK